MGGVQQAGVARLVKALAPVLAVPAVQVDTVDQPGPAAGACRRPAPPPRRACCLARSPSPPGYGHVRPLGGLRPWPDSSSKQSQAPRSAAVLLSRARSPPVRRRWPPRPARRRGGPGPARSTRSGAAAYPSRPACTRPRTCTSSAIRVSVQHWSCHLEAAGPASSTASSSRSCAGVSLHRAPPAPLRGQRLLPAGRQRPPPPVRRHPRHPELFRDPRSLAPASSSSAADSRTCSRRARSAAVSPPPSGYLMVLA
jgi:hypothetical protein